MFTDGDDRNRVTSPACLQGVAAKSSAFVYVVFFGRGNGTVRPVLADVARQSGGAVINSSNLETAFKQVLDMLATNYVLTYTPTGVSRRRGYWAQ